MLSCLEDKKHSVKSIVLMEKPDVELVSQAKCSGIDVISMGEMEVSTPIKNDSFIVYIFKLGLIFSVFCSLVQHKVTIFNLNCMLIKNRSTGRLTFMKYLNL